MHVIFPDNGRIGRFFRHLRGCDEPQLDEFPGGKNAHQAFVLRFQDSGFQNLFGVGHHIQHAFIHSALAGGEFSVHGNGAGHVGVVIPVFRAYIHKHQIAVFAPFVVLDIMQHAGILSGSDDGQDGEFARTAADEFVGQESLNLPFAHPRPDESEQFPEAFIGDVAGFFESLDFFRLFDLPHIRHDFIDILQNSVREFFLQLLGHAGIARFHRACASRMLVGFHKDHGCGRHQGLQQRIIFIGPAHVLDAAQLSRLFLREPGTFPDGNLFICLTQQQNLIPAVLPDGHDQDGFFLVNSRKIKEVGILMQGKSAVRIRRKYVVGVQNQHTAGRQAGSKFFTVAGKKGRRKRLVSHINSMPRFSGLSIMHPDTGQPCASPCRPEFF